MQKSHLCRQLNHSRKPASSYQVRALLARLTSINHPIMIEQYTCKVSGGGGGAAILPVGC